MDWCSLSLTRQLLYFKPYSIIKITSDIYIYIYDEKKGFEKRIPQNDLVALEWVERGGKRVMGKDSEGQS